MKQKKSQQKFQPLTKTLLFLYHPKKTTCQKQKQNITEVFLKLTLHQLKDDAGQVGI